MSALSSRPLTNERRGISGVQQTGGSVVWTVNGVNIDPVGAQLHSEWPRRQLLGASQRERIPEKRSPGIIRQGHSCFGYNTCGQGMNIEDQLQCSRFVVHQVLIPANRSPTERCMVIYRDDKDTLGSISRRRAHVHSLTKH